MFPFIAQNLLSFKNRSYQKELIDLGDEYYSEEEYFDCLEKLGAVGRLLGGDRATLKSFSRADPKPFSTLAVVVVLLHNCYLKNFINVNSRHRHEQKSH